MTTPPTKHLPITGVTDAITAPEPLTLEQITAAIDAQHAAIERAVELDREEIKRLHACVKVNLARLAKLPRLAVTRTRKARVVKP